MLDRLPKPLRRLAAMFASFSSGQKAVTLVGLVALVAGAVLFANWAGKPTYAPLFSNLSGTDASAIVEELNASGVPYELSDGGGTILVPQNQVYDARIQMSGKGLPAADDTGYALLDKQGVTTSDFQQHVNYQRALEGELASTIKSIDGVQAATVHLVIPKEDIFSDDAKKPTASVLVTSQASGQLTSEQVQAVVHLVASSVEGLDPNNVTMADSEGTVLSTGDGKGVTGGVGGGDRAKQTQAFEARMNAAVQSMLESVVGPGKAIVKTTADLDFDATETKSERYTAQAGVPPLTENTKREAYEGGGGAAGGVLGPDNVQVPAGAAGADEYESVTEERKNAVGLITETRQAAPGGVRKLNVSVLMDATTAGGVENAQVQQMVSAAVGLNAARGDTIAVTSLPFDDSAAEDVEKAEADAAAIAEREQLLSMAKTGAMVLAVLLLLLWAWLASRKARKAQLTEEDLAQLAEMQAALEAAEARAIAPLGDAMPALAAAPVDTRDEDREARQREISEMVENQPDEVARLLRGWLADRRT